MELRQFRASLNPVDSISVARGPAGRLLLVPNLISKSSAATEMESLAFLDSHDPPGSIAMQ
jgi:hypothetical protein